ncbi:hypothetical protein BDY19DRAFT_909014 [Irpex rosettiformis]|uniref:Uncharacterized protein n=1 Tax=Irpex rosettiformis TaxID=378272 RepID=A0ACB8TTK6_9APHY|nr:hypothetical protein BDY19DRAFT_909014 [Irpex rosettiformis]
MSMPLPTIFSFWALCHLLFSQQHMLFYKTAQLQKLLLAFPSTTLLSRRSTLAALLSPHSVRMQDAELLGPDAHADVDNVYLPFSFLGSQWSTLTFQLWFVVSSNNINAVISVEVPDDPGDAELVLRHMRHKHPLSSQPPNTYYQCVNAQGDRYCHFHYPHALQSTTTIDAEGRCYINFEAAGPSYIFQYIFKYIHKVTDDLTVSAQYLSATEGAWCIMGYSITRKVPSITALPVCTSPHVTRHRYHTGNANSLSLLERYFLRPHGTFQLQNGETQSFDDLSYLDYYKLFRLKRYQVTDVGLPFHYPEQPNSTGATRMHHHPVCLFEDCHLANGVIFPTFQDAANKLGLFASDQEAEYAMMEAIADL